MYLPGIEPLQPDVEQTETQTRTTTGASTDCEYEDKPVTLEKKKCDEGIYL